MIQAMRTCLLGNGNWSSFKSGARLDTNVLRQLQQQLSFIKQLSNFKFHTIKFHNHNQPIERAPQRHRCARAAKHPSNPRCFTCRVFHPLCLLSIVLLRLQSQLISAHYGEFSLIFVQNSIILFYLKSHKLGSNMKYLVSWHNFIRFCYFFL